MFTSEDIGKTITISSENEADTLDMLTRREYTIVGLAQSSRFISSDRGSTSVGSGSVTGFVYLPESAFDSEVYHELLICAGAVERIFSDEYDQAIDAPTEDECKDKLMRLI